MMSSCNNLCDCIRLVIMVGEEKTKHISEEELRKMYSQGKLKPPIFLYIMFQVWKVILIGLTIKAFIWAWNWLPL